MWKLILCVFVGSGLGGVTRFLVSTWFSNVLQWRSLGSLLPWATLTVNIAGCFIIGLIYGLIEHGANISPAWRTAITVGFCGGLTTFSTFGREALLMIQSGQICSGLIYTFISVIVGITAAWAGFALGR